MKRLVLLSGPVRSGKSNLAAALERRADARVLSTKELLLKALGLASPPSRAELQAAGANLDKSTGGAWVRDALLALLRSPERESVVVVVDSVRTASQIRFIRSLFGLKVVHVHLTAADDVLAKRLSKREDLREAASLAEARKDPTEAAVPDLADDAEIVIDTGRSSLEDVAVRAMHRLGLMPSPGTRLVDVIVGGQYGSEGKGQIAGFLAREYELLVRVGGPNAGHKVKIGDSEMTHRSLPSGTSTSEARLLIGAGAVIDVRGFLEEVETSRCQDRLWIDPSVMTIVDEDRERERQLVKAIGSTGQGVGEATARRITGRVGGVVLAKDVPELQPYLRPGLEVLEDAYRRGFRILLEGTQGTALSLFHGPYPHVTSRDTTVSGCLAEAGIPPGRVRRVVMTCRTYPIRVMSPPGQTSGPMNRELSWEDVSRRSGTPVDELLTREKGSVSKKPRRVGEFEWDLLHESSLLNRPTDIALTFADYVDKRNADAVRFDQLTEPTIQFIEEVETVAQCPVTLISTRFGYVIDRRSW